MAWYSSAEAAAPCAMTVPDPMIVEVFAQLVGD
jgi:hypothetical protein